MMVDIKPSNMMNQAQQQNSNCFVDKELLSDCLTSQKMITGTYNNFANECACENLRSEFLNILQQEHKMQADVFNELQKRGWYQVQQADMQQINQTKQKFMQQSQQ